MTVFTKKRNAMSSTDYETWEQSETARCLNTFEGGQTAEQPCLLWKGKTMEDATRISDDLIRLGGIVHGKHQVKMMTLELFTYLVQESDIDPYELLKILDMWLHKYYELEND